MADREYVGDMEGEVKRRLIRFRVRGRCRRENER